MNTGYCPETSKDANGYNRYYRIKVLLNVAEYVKKISTLYSAKAQRGGRSDAITDKQEDLLLLGGLLILPIYPIDSFGERYRY